MVFLSYEISFLPSTRFPQTDFILELESCLKLLRIKDTALYAIPNQKISFDFVLLLTTVLREKKKANQKRVVSYLFKLRRSQMLLSAT